MRYFREMAQLMDVTDTQLDKVDKMTLKVLDNAFIESCDEYGIAKYESYLKITPTSYDTLETRKARVLLRWSEYEPFTMQVLRNKLNTLCGDDNYIIDDRLTEYYMFLTTYLEGYDQVKELEEWLERILPQNIVYGQHNIINMVAASDTRMGGASCYTDVFNCSDDAKYVINVTNGLGNGGTYTYVDVVNESDASKYIINVTNKLGNGGTHVYVDAVDGSDDAKYVINVTNKLGNGGLTNDVMIIDNSDSSRTTVNVDSRTSSGGAVSFVEEIQK
jgi:hypothetical protein